MLLVTVDWLLFSFVSGSFCFWIILWAIGSLLLSSLCLFGSTFGSVMFGFCVCSSVGFNNFLASSLIMAGLLPITNVDLFGTWLLFVFIEWAVPFNCCSFSSLLRFFSLFFR